VFQTINDPNPVIASLHFVSLAMTIGHFFPWKTLMVNRLLHLNHTWHRLLLMLISLKSFLVVWKKLVLKY